MFLYWPIGLSKKTAVPRVFKTKLPFVVVRAEQATHHINQSNKYHRIPIPLFEKIPEVTYQINQIKIPQATHHTNQIKITQGTHHASQSNKIPQDTHFVSPSDKILQVLIQKIPQGTYQIN